MIARALILALCALPLMGFTSDDKATMKKECTASLVAAKTRGLPPGLFDKRDAVCGCITDKVAGEATFSDDTKKVITKIFAVEAKSKREEAQKLRKKLPKGVNNSMRKLVRACTKQHTQKPK